jgi:hypothetical protein
MYFLSQVAPLQMTHGTMEQVYLESAVEKANRQAGRTRFWRIVKDYQSIILFISLGLLALLGKFLSEFWP